MERIRKLADSPSAEIGLYGIFFLFFFQLISDFVEGIYAFGLLGTSIPPELASVVLLFAPALLWIWPRIGQNRMLSAVGLLAIASRVLEPMLLTKGRMIVSGIGTGAFLLFFPAWLWELGRRKGWGSASPRLGAGLTLALVVSVCLRVSYSGFDISTVGGFQVIGWLLALVAAVLLWAFTDSGLDRRVDLAVRREASAGLGRITGLSLGMTAVWILLYFAFTSPNVIARWTGASYLGIVVLLMLMTSLFAWLLVNRTRWLLQMKPVLFWSLNVVFITALVWLISSHQIAFPAEPGAYPLAEPALTWWHQVPLILLLISFPVILLDFILLSQSLLAVRPTRGALAASFVAASLLLLVLILAQVFTTVYDYIPVVGPFFRDKFWLVFLVAGLILMLALRLVKIRPADSVQPVAGRTFAGTVGAIAVAALVLIFLVSARPEEQQPARRTVRVLTYNIQQGYSEDGLKNFAGQLALMREIDADIIGLQESDTNRIAGGNADLVRYFADRLDMYSYYGPKVVPGTFGIALLSKYPIDQPRTFYMYSEGEQTAAISAQVRIDGQTFNLLVTHLGNGGPKIQQEAVLQEVRGQASLLMMGDFNFRPDSEPYQLTRQSWEDAWLWRWPEGVDDQGVEPADRIDHLFVSPGTRVRDIRYLTGPQSDHPALWADIEW